MPSILASIHLRTYTPPQLSPSSHPLTWAGCQGLMLPYSILHARRIPRLKSARPRKIKWLSVAIIKGLQLLPNDLNWDHMSHCVFGVCRIITTIKSAFGWIDFKLFGRDTEIMLFVFPIRRASNLHLERNNLPVLCTSRLSSILCLSRSTCCSLSTPFCYCVESLNRLVLMSPSGHSRGPFIADTHVDTLLPGWDVPVEALVKCECVHVCEEMVRIGSAERD